MISKLDLAKIIADQQQLFHQKNGSTVLQVSPINSNRIIIVTGVSKVWQKHID